MDSQAHKFQLPETGPILRCKRRKADGGIVDGCGWQGPPESGDMCPSCGGLILRVVSLGTAPTAIDVDQRKPYAVQYGPACSESATFATFGEALAFYRGYWAALMSQPSIVPSGAQCRIVNTDRLDGAEDGNPSGLTEDERELLGNAE